jgi:exosome complex component RRP4
LFQEKTYKKLLVLDRLIGDDMMVPDKKTEKEVKPVKKEQAMAGKPAEKPPAEAKPAEIKGLLKQDREFVIPGDKIVETMDFLPGKNCFRKGDSVFAKKIGLVSVNGRVVSVIPMNEVYAAKPGDMVIGEVMEVQSNGWVINIKSHIEAYLPLSGVREFIDTTKTNLSKYYSTGDVVYAKISHVNYNSIHLSMDDSRARKFRSGRIIKFNSAKVPRLIGKQGSMISLIKGRTGCRISVGQNGLVWLEGENEELAIQAINVVESESYTEGLTDRISAFLEKSAPAAKTEQPTDKKEIKTEDKKEIKK